MEPIGPYPLTLDQVLELPPATDEHANAIVISNASPYTCSVAINGPQQWLGPWTADLYAYEPGAYVQITPSVALTGGSTDNTLTATYIDPTDSVASAAYPQTLTSQAIAAAITNAVAIDGTVSVNVTEGSITVSSGNVTIDGNVTVDVQGASSGTPSGANPSFTSRDVSAYSFGYVASGGAVTNAGLVGSPPGSYNNTELHSLLVNNYDQTSYQVVELYAIAGGQPLFRAAIPPAGSVTFDYRGMRIGNSGVEVTSQLAVNVILTYTWITT